MMALSPVRARSCTSRWRRRRTRSSACFSTYARNHRVLHSFPTRRSSDLLILGISPRYGLEARSLTRFAAQFPDRKSTRLNSSHVEISYAVFCLKKKMHDDAVGRARALLHIALEAAEDPLFCRGLHERAHI